MQKIIAIVGPTASGKTAFSIALAKHYGAEIVSCDSMQIYREMQIGTAKPDDVERDNVPHHLMGHVGVETTYNVAEYVRDASVILSDLKKRDVLPILCGGTGLYLQHLLESTDFFDIPIIDEVRERYQRLAKESGGDVLFGMLEERDPVLAARLHPNDIKRVVRGLEVFETTGKPLSQFQKESHRDSPYEVLYLGLNYRDRSVLYDRINRRVDLMVKRGLLNEVEDLMEKYTLSSTARAAIGYKEIIDAIEAQSSMNEAIALIKQKSRNYAKRQLSWFRRNPSVHWFYADELSLEELVYKSVTLTDSFLKGENK